MLYRVLSELTLLSSQSSCITWIHHICSDSGFSSTNAYSLTVDRFAWRAVAEAESLKASEDDDDDEDDDDVVQVRQCRA